MTLRQLEYFLAVVQEGSFTRAAQRLLVSQPALSHQIKTLEQSLGARLLERLPRAVRLTRPGERLLPHAIASVRSAEEATKAAMSVARLEAGELRVGALQSIALGIVPPAIQAWRHAHPRVRVEITEFTHIDALAADMTRGGADVAIGPKPAGWRGPTRPLGAEEFVVVLPADDPLLRNASGPIGLERLARRRWVLYAPDFGLATVVGDACAAAGFAPRAAARAHHTATAVELAAAGLGPALVPSNIVGPDFTACVLHPDPPVRRELVAFLRAAPSPAASAFIDVLADHARVRP